MHDEKLSAGIITLPVIEKGGRSKLVSIKLSILKEYLRRF